MVREADRGVATVSYLPPIPQAPAIDIEPTGDGQWCGSLLDYEGTAIVQCIHPTRSEALESVREWRRAVIAGIRQKLARSN